MKVESIGKAGNGKDIINLRIGGEELELIRALVNKALEFTPKVKQTTPTLERLRNMNKCLHSKVVSDLILSGDSE